MFTMAHETRWSFPGMNPGSYEYDSLLFGYVRNIRNCEQIKTALLLKASGVNAEQCPLVSTVLL
jgi:hypothetical protein